MKIIFALALAFAFQATTFAHNHGSKTMADALSIEKSWARETFKMAKSGAAYGSFTNTGKSDITIVGASIDPNVASMVELHETKMIDGMMRMQELSDGITLAPGESVDFTPGGKHFMLMGLKGPLQAEKPFEISLVFADESEKVIRFNVQDMRTVVN